MKTTTDDEKIYQTLQAGIQKLRELQDPCSKPSEIVVMTASQEAVNHALNIHGQCLNRNGVIKTRFCEKLRRLLRMTK